MTSEEGAGSVTIWIGDLKDDGDSAAQHLMNRYWEKLATLARQYLRSRFPQGGARDEGDALINAFDTLFRRARENRFPNLANRDDLWRLLVVITKRKIQKGVGIETSQKNGGGKVIHLGGVAPDDGGPGGVDQEASRSRWSPARRTRSRPSRSSTACSTCSATTRCGLSPS
jgi:ECF sigma factor